MSSVGALPQVESVSRLLSLPVVQAGFSLASNGYGRVRNMHPLTEAAFQKAEATVTFAVEMSKPVVGNVAGKVKPVEPIVVRVDNFFCAGLDILESRVPAVKKTPAEILDDGRQKVEFIRKIGSDRLNEAKGYGASRVALVKSHCINRVGSVVNARYLQAVIHSLDTAMDLTEQAVDRYLPEVEGEPKRRPLSKDHRLSERYGHLGDKMRHRVTYHVTIQLENLQKHGREVYGLWAEEARRIMEQLTAFLQQLLSRASVPRPLAIHHSSCSHSQSRSAVPNGSSKSKTSTKSHAGS